MTRAIISFFILFSLQHFLAVSGSSECSKDCLDDPLLCDLLVNPWKVLTRTRGIDLRIACKNPFFTFICPNSCKICVPCTDDTPEVEEGDDGDTEPALQSLSAQANQAAPENPPATTEAATTTLAETTLAETTIAETTLVETTLAETTLAETTLAATTTLAPTTTTTEPTTPAPIEPVSIKVVTTAASKSYGGNDGSWGMQRALDGDAGTIYHSAPNKNAYAKFYIPKSKVTTVRVKNRADCCGERMTGEIVEMCNGDADCVKCGEFSAVGNGQWGTMTCGDDQGIEGNVLKVTAPAAYLQIAEIEVLGQAMGKLEKMDIIGATSSGEYGSSGKYILSYSYDNNGKTFYHSSGYKGFAKYEVEETAVTVVRIQNRPDCCGDRLTNAKVWVCSDETEGSCTLCGTLTDNYDEKQWAAMECGGGDGIQGSFVKVQSANTYLQITEIEIYANKN